MSRAASVLLLAVLAAPAVGAEDYDSASKEWNGLADFVALAASTGRTVETRRELDWNDLGPNDALFILYPTARVDAVKLAEHIRGGGRVLIADDFGRADEALARLGLLRRRGGGANRVHDGNRNLPMASASGLGHPLARGGAEIVTNHPAVFAAAAGVDAVYTIGRDEVVVAAGQIDDGRFVALSDPSILINDMLAFDGNLAFAVNLLDWLVPPGGKIVLATGGFAITGEPRPAHGGANHGDDPHPRGSLGELLGDLRDWLDGLNDYLAPDEGLRAGGLILALILVIGGAVVAPLRRPPEADGSFTRAGGEPATSERLLAEYDDDQPGRNYAYPAAILRENVESELGARLPLPARLAELPTRADVLTGRAFISRRDFLAACAAAPPSPGSEPR